MWSLLSGERDRNDTQNFISKKCENEPLGVLLEYIDGTEVCGNILVSNMKRINFLFCNHLLYHERVDVDYEEEYQEAGLEHSCALFSYEDLLRGKLSLYGEEISGLTIYRGWMMKPEMYRQFYKLLEERNIILINSPDEYERYHLLPGWYEEFKNETAESVWETEGSIESVYKLAKGLQGSYIIKDYVKSRKHEWYDVFFIRNISDNEKSMKIISNFINRQGTDLVGGVVLRKYEKIKQIGFHEKSGMPISEKYRVFVLAGQVLAIEDYWCKGRKVTFSEAEWKWIRKMTAKINSNFVTMDIARKEDNNLMIIELGDGQVSGLQQIRPYDFYTALQI